MLKYKVLTTQLVIGLMLSNVVLANANQKEVSQEGVSVVEEGIKEDVEGVTEEVKVEGVKEEDIEEVTEEEDTEVEVVEEEIIDVTDREVTEGFHIRVQRVVEPTEKEFKDIIPEVTLELYNGEGKKIGEGKGDSSNYDTTNLCYNVAIKDIGSYKKGDKLEIRVKESDSIVKSIKALELEVKGEGENIIEEIKEYNLIKGGEGVKFEVDTRIGDTLYKGKEVLRVEGSKDAPYIVTMETDVSKIGVKIVDEKGGLVKGKEFEIERTFDGSKFKAYTDSKGVLWLERGKVEPVIKVRSTDKEYEFEGYDGRGEIVFPITSTSMKISDFLSTTLTLKEAKEVELGGNTGGAISNLEKVGVKLEVKGDTRLTDDWVEGELILTEKEKGYIYEFEISKDMKELEGIPKGVYDVKVKSDQAKIEVVDKLSIKDSKGVLNIKVEPKHKLEVSKEVDGKSKSYDFSVINIEKVKGEKYKGKGKEEFGVVGGGSYVIKDNESSKTYTVDVKKGEEVTRLVLGDGVLTTVKGDVTTPHTSDSLLGLLGLLGVSLVLGGGVGYKIYESKREIEEREEE